MKTLFAVLVFFSLGFGAFHLHAGERYRDEIFSAVKVSRDLQYGQALNHEGKNEILRLDLYQPEGDTALQRPAIVWIHGGGLTRGSKDTETMVILCERFAKRGYVTASIDYRLRDRLATAQDSLTAVIDAMHDAKAALRWLRSKAETHRLDTTRVAIGGASAGAATALHAAYVEDEGNSGNPGHSSEASACLELWGAMLDYGAIEAGEPPVLIIHGTADPLVPFTEALKLQARAQAVGVPFELHALEGAGHSPWQFMEDYVAWASEFLYKHVIKGISTSIAGSRQITPASIRLLQNYPNPFSLSRERNSGASEAAATSIAYEVLTPGEVMLKVFNMLGQEVASLASGPHESGVYTQKFFAVALPAGLYFYRLQARNTVLTRKMIVTK